MPGKTSGAKGNRRRSSLVKQARLNAAVNASILTSPSNQSNQSECINFNFENHGSTNLEDKSVNEESEKPNEIETGRCSLSPIPMIFDTSPQNLNPKESSDNIDSIASTLPEESFDKYYASPTSSSTSIVNKFVECNDTFSAKKKSIPDKDSNSMGLVKDWILKQMNTISKESKQQPPSAPETMRFKCVLCSKSFPFKQTLTCHIKTMHLNRKCIRCRICSKEFHRMDVMKYHTLSHFPEMKHKCPHCSRTYNQSLGLKGHILARHSDEVFQCHSCPKQYKYRSSMMRHQGRKH